MRNKLLIIASVCVLSLFSVQQAKAVSCGPISSALSVMNAVSVACNPTPFNCSSYIDKIEAVCESIELINAGVLEFQSLGTMSLDKLGPTERVQYINYWRNYSLKMTSTVKTMGQAVNGEFMDIHRITRQIQQLRQRSTVADEDQKNQLLSEIEGLIGQIDQNITEAGREAKNTNDRVMGIRYQFCNRYNC